MSGPQFIHVEGYARKATNGKTTTASAVIGEAIRAEGFTSHLSAPQRPRFIHGSSEGLEDLDKVLHEAAEVAKDAQGRKMRSDQTLLLAGVTSFPKPTIGLTSEDLIEIESWIKETNAFLYKEFGKNFKAALLHTDEEYPHIHFYVADVNNPLKTKDLHPARAGAKSKEKKDGITNLKAFQDRYNEQVGIKFGMTRLGPRRERLSRADWMSKKEQAKELAKKLKELTILEAKAEVAICEADAAKTAAMIEKAHWKNERSQVKKQIEILTNAAEKYNSESNKLKDLGLKVPIKPMALRQSDELLESLKSKTKPKI